MFDFMTVDEAAAKWDVAVQQVRKLCLSGEIAGAMKKGRMWLIPGSVEHPHKRNLRLREFRGTKKKVFEAAIKLFAERSFDAITLKDIADETGIAQSAIYRYFKSKQEMLDEIYAYFTHHYTADRPRIEELKPVIERGTPREILHSVIYNFSSDYGDLLVACTRIILQRMSVDESAGEIFRTLMLQSGLDYAERVYASAVVAGTLPPADTFALSVFSNMCRQIILLSWLANADPAMHERLIQCQDTLIDLVIKGMTPTTGQQSH